MNSVYRFYHGRKRVETLLSGFINNKINNYVEPERQGVPKGNAIGFSKKKFTACLLMITKATQKVIAKDAGISFGTLRNWNTQKSFRKMVDNNCSEFAEIVFNHINTKMFEEITLHNEYMEGVIDERPPDPTPFRLWDEFRDLDNYEEKLITEIDRTIHRKIYRLRGTELFYTYSEYFGVFLRALKGEKYKPTKTEIELEKEILKLRIKMIMKILEHDVLTKKDKRFITEAFLLLVREKIGKLT